MPASTDDALQPLYAFAERWLDRALDEQERVRLQELALAMAGASATPAPSTGERAAGVIETERQRVQGVIARMLANAQDTAQRELHARGGDTAALKVVRASPTLGDLRPSALRAPQPGETPNEQLVITQIADRLGNLIRAEVDACFNKRFGPAQAPAPAGTLTPAHPSHTGTTASDPPPEHDAGAAER